MTEKEEGVRRREKGAAINLPPVIFGTSGLGNLFVALDEETKYDIVKECLRLFNGRVVFDSAGKYGAGLALEVLGRCLRRLNVSPDQVLISNKLAWLRTELKTPEPSFEPGVWKDLKHDAVQKISYEGIMECFEQGNELLGGYVPQMVSVHDPDEYLATAKDEKHAAKLYNDVLEAYNALFDLKKQGKVKAIGLGAKDWRVIRRIAGDVALDWVMIANSFTVRQHPQELIDFMIKLEAEGVDIINAAVFHSGFLAGGSYFDYRLIKTGTTENDELYNWRSRFFEVCRSFNVKPAAACVVFGINGPGVKSIALNTTEVKRIKENIQFTREQLPGSFWDALQTEGLIQINPYSLKNQNVIKRQM